MADTISTPDEESDAPEIGQIPQLSKRFEPITDEHERIVNDVERYINDFIEIQDKAHKPIGIRGPYRSGKTQLEYHAFDYAWDNGVPAVYIGSPDSALSEFEDSDLDSISDWLDQRSRDEISSLISTGDMEWFPQVPDQQRKHWISNRVTEEFSDFDENDRYVIIIDELEQSYEEFLRATGADDDNPLRKLNDELPDTLSIWSFGLLSAYEFVGDADMGRPREVSIPPVDVDTVREMLENKTENVDLTPLTNVVWWASRGRAAWVNKIVEEMSEEVLSSPMSWLVSLTDYQSVEVDMVNPIWGEVTGGHEEAAAALAFQEDGHEEWLIKSDDSIREAEAIEIIEVALSEVTEIDPDDNTKQILYKNLSSVVSGLSLDREGYSLLPVSWLNEDMHADALLDLVQYHLVSFQPSNDEREVAYDILENAKGFLSEKWVNSMMGGEHSVSRKSWTVDPQKVKDAFPPLVMNPDRLTSSDMDSEDLRSDMESGMVIDEDDLVNMYFCPTQNTFDDVIENKLTSPPDITQPSLVFVPEDVETDMNAMAEALERYDVISLEPNDTQRVWDFITQVYGYLREETQETDPYYLDGDLVEDLAEDTDEREVRTALETLYKHLIHQTSADPLMTQRSEYIDRFSRSNSDDNVVIWAEEEVGYGDWTQAPLSDQRFSLPVLLGWSEEPNCVEEGKIPKKIHEALQEDEIISTDNFKYTELIDANFSESADGGFTSTADTIHEEHRIENEGPVSTINGLSNLLWSLIQNRGTDEVYDALDDMDFKGEKVPILSNMTFPDPVRLDDEDPLSVAVVRAAMLNAILRESSRAAEKAEGVKEELEHDKKTIQEYTRKVEDAEEYFSSPDWISDLEEIEFDTEELKTYEDNIDEIISALEKAKDKSEKEDAAPMVYVLSELARRYQEFMSEKLEDIRENIPDDGDIPKVKGLRNALFDLKDEVNEYDLWSKYDDLPSQTKAEEAVDEIATQSLDLTDIGGKKVPVPDDNGVIKSIDDTAEDRLDAVDSLLDSMKELTDKYEEHGALLDSTEEELKDIIDEIVQEGEEDD
jgi:hypothetical protein